MLLLPGPQKFNTFNTFNTFDIFTILLFLSLRRGGASAILRGRTVQLLTDGTNVKDEPG